MAPRWPLPGAKGSYELPHVDNAAVAGHFDTDTPPRQPRSLGRRGNVPQEGRGKSVTCQVTTGLHSMTNLS